MTCRRQVIPSDIRRRRMESRDLPNINWSFNYESKVIGKKDLQ